MTDRQDKYVSYLLLAGGIYALYTVIQIIEGLKDAGHDVATALGLSDSDARKYEDQVYNSGVSPLFSYTLAKLIPGNPNIGAWYFNPPDYSGLVAKLEDARGYLFEDTDKALEVFQTFKSQFQVADFAAQFQDIVGQDLFYYIRKSDTAFAQGFKSQTVAAIIQMVNRLPVYG